MDKNRIRGASAGRAGNVSRSPYPSTARSVALAALAAEPDIDLMLLDINMPVMGGGLTLLAGCVKSRRR